MAEKSDQQVVEGVLISGAEGELYFIPNDDMAAYRVPDDIAEPSKRTLAEKSDVNWRPGSPSSTGVRTLPAYQGPIGRRDVISAPQDPTVLVATDWGLR